MPSFSDTVAMIFRVEADTSDAKKDLSGLEDVITKQAGVINAQGVKAFEDLASKIGISGEAATGLTSALGPAAIAIGAVAAAATGVGVALYKMASEAADVGSKLHDAGQQAGVNAATIQALKYAADESGSSLEKMTGSVAKFSTLLGQAAAGNEKAQATLAQYGITATTVDAALAQALETIATMTNHTQQAAAAAALFKDRTGEILPVIQSFDGDLPALIKKLQDLGIMMSQDDLDAADAFGDHMDDLKKQLEAVRLKIGTELLPVFNDWAVAVSTWLSTNKGEVEGWAKSVSNAVEYVGLAIEDYTNSIGEFKAVVDAFFSGATSDEIGEVIAKFETAADRIDIAIKNIGKAKGGLQDQGETVLFPGSNLPPVGQKPMSAFDPTAAKAAADAAKKAEDDAKKRKKDADEAFKKSLSDQKDNVKAYLNETRENNKTTVDSLIEQFKAGGITAQQFAARVAASVIAYKDQSVKFINELSDVEKKQADSDTQRDTVRINRLRQLKAVQDDVRKQAEAAKKLVGDRQIAALSANVKALENQKKAQDQAEAAADKNRKLTADSYDTIFQQWDDQLAAGQRVLDAADKGIAAYDQRKAAADAESEKERQQRVVELTQPFELLQGYANDKQLSAMMSGDWMDTAKYTAASAGINALGTAFSSLGEALGDAAYSWVLYGKAAGNIQQVTAMILASIAKQAAVQAVWELAQGLAALALAWIFPQKTFEASLHFASAGVYAGIAGIAALAGRGVAGNAFASQTAGATGTADAGTGTQGSKSTAGGAYSGQSDQIIETGANGPGTYFIPQQTIVIKDQTGMMGKLLQWEIETNSSVRQLIVETANAA